MDEKAEEITTVFEVNGKTVDLAAALPITLGDERALNKLGVPFAEVESWVRDPEKRVKFILYFLHKVDPAVTEEEVYTLTLGQIARISQAINRATEADLPFFARSISSPGPTDGGQTS